VILIESGGAHVHGSKDAGQQVRAILRQVNAETPELYPEAGAARLDAQDGFLFLDRGKFRFPCRPPALDQAQFMADSQVRWASTRSLARLPGRPGAASRLRR
jgi:hypothetical protein